MGSLIEKFINLGVDNKMSIFKITRVKILNRLILILFVCYLLAIPLDIYLGIYDLAIIIFIFSLLLFVSSYFNYKQQFHLARYSLTINAWGLLTVLALYTGSGGGHIYAFVPTAIIWYLIYNRVKEIVIVQILNFLNGVLVYLMYQNLDPLFQGNQELLVMVKGMIIALCIISIVLAIGIFKTSNYRLALENRKQQMRLYVSLEEVDSSIKYALGIQKGLLPKESTLNELAINNFVFYKPKDIVSGDFYWTHEDDEKTFIALGDCTGHGVPGALVSVLGISSLDVAIEHGDIKMPADLLALVDKRFMSKMTKAGLNDGMDITIIMYDKIENKWSMSSANNSVLIVSENESTIIKGDKIPIGKYGSHKGSFNNIPLNVKPNDMIYIYSDGYRDQFGGKKGKKLGIRMFNELLVSISPHSCNKKKTVISEYFEQWKGKLEQIDDVSVIGIKVH